MSDKELIKQEIERLSDEYPMSRGLLKHLTKFIDSLPEEPASEDLDEAAKEFGIRQGVELKPFAIKFFKAGAEWQKQKDQETIELAEDHAMLAGMMKEREEMMKNAVGAIFIQDYAYKTPVLYGDLKHKMNIVSGQKITLCQIKENQQ